ncbi:MAG: hydrogenase formation protein HypD [Desulfomonile sp.]|nr:hydrogenase formation protein HypD [Desulfomonile sp.]
MNPADENRTAQVLAREIHERCLSYGRPLRLMEVCGTHTMAIAESGIKSLLPDNLQLVSGPGCPVCVTEKVFIDQALETGRRYDACLVTFGDLVRVPGSSGSLAGFRSEGGSVRVVYSPLDAIEIAAKGAPRPVVFLGVGFETTVPTVAATVKVAKTRGVTNLFVLPAFKTIHRPLEVLAAKVDLHGFLLPGHVSAILGSDCYRYLVTDYGKPGVVAGFEPLDILVALRDLVTLAASGSPDIVNDYRRVVRPAGNPTAQATIYEVFEEADASWRGLGLIPGSGLKFRPEYASFDATTRLQVEVPPAKDDPRCLCAAILTGSRTPDKCGLFGRECTPEEPVGPCMVSSEGTCAAYYKYGLAAGR